MDPQQPSEALAAAVGNLRELIERDRWFGVSSLPKLQPAATGAAPVPPPVTPAVPPQEPAPTAPLGLPADLEGIAERIAACTRCGLCRERSRTVPGEGDPHPALLFIGEGPGADEDRQGRPFVGAAGQLLDKMISAMGLAREQVFIANVVKCRPPGNRTPTPEEIAACLPYLEAQVDALRPRVICTLGATPLKALLGQANAGITRLRGKPFTWRGVTVLPTYHPSYLLRNPAAKKPCWSDLQQVLALLAA